MTRPKAVEVDPGFVFEVAINMRDRDAEEVLATGNMLCRGQWAEGIANRLAHFDGNQVLRGFRYRNKPTAVFGALEAWPGMWSAWMVATDDWHKVALSATKHILRAAIPDVWAAGAHRIEARSMSSYVQAHRWMQRLGAAFEARLHGYGRAGQDFDVYVWRAEHV